MSGSFTETNAVEHMSDGRFKRWVVDQAFTYIELSLLDLAVGQALWSITSTETGSITVEKISVGLPQERTTEIVGSGLTGWK
jgi:hypothetical protein